MADSYPQRVLPDPRFATSDLPLPPEALRPPQQYGQPALARLRVPGDAYDDPLALDAPPAPPSDWDVANAALAARAADVNPVAGVKRAVKGMAVLGRALPQDDDFLQRGGLPSPGPRPSLREAAGGAADILGGSMDAGAVFLPGAIAKAPLKVGASLLAGTAVGEGVYAAGEKLGVPREYVDLAAQALGLGAGIATHAVLDSPRARADLLAKARELYHSDQGAIKLPDLGGPKRELLTEPGELRPGQGAKPVGAGASETAAATPLNIAEVASNLFPKLDAYAKPAGLLSSKTILKRLDRMPDMSPEIRASLERVAAQIGDRRAMPEEVQALARGETYTPSRIVRRVNAPAEGVKQRVGAPYGVTNARQERGLRERYMQTMDLGKEGRDWYDEAGNAIMFYANDDPVRANQVAGDLAITSPTAEVSGNTSMGVKGYNQANAGALVRAGRYPTEMAKRITENHLPFDPDAVGVTGPKRYPFQQNLARGGGFPLRWDPPRAVHDIWDAEAHGYMNPDGSPMRSGFGPAQHRWMDAQQDKIIATSNQRALGGFTNWDELKSQAAAWTGAQIRAGRLDPKDAARSYANYFEGLVAQGSRETIPGRTTGHMPQLLESGMEPFRQHLHNTMMNEAGIYDAKGRDQIAAGYGGLVGRAFEGPGLFQGEISPGMQTKVLTGSQSMPNGPTGAREMDEGSRRLMNASEATYALGMGQDVGAWSRLLPAGSGAPRGLWDVALPGGTITNAQLKGLALRIPNIGKMAVISTDDGVRLGNMDKATARKIVKMLGGTVKESGAGLDTGQGSGYMENNFRVDRAGQQFLDPIRLMGTNRFNEFAPAMFDRIRRADAMFRRDTGGRFSLSQMRDELLGTVAGEGFQGLERLAKKYAIPVTLLVAGLQALGHPVPPGAPQPPSPSGSSPE